MEGLVIESPLHLIAEELQKSVEQLIPRREIIRLLYLFIMHLPPLQTVSFFLAGRTVRTSSEFCEIFGEKHPITATICFVHSSGSM